MVSYHHDVSAFQRARCLDILDAVLREEFFDNRNHGLYLFISGCSARICDDRTLSGQYCRIFYEAGIREILIGIKYRHLYAAALQRFNICVMLLQRQLIIRLSKLWCGCNSFRNLAAWSFYDNIFKHNFSPFCPALLRADSSVFVIFAVFVVFALFSVFSVLSAFAVSSRSSVFAFFSAVFSQSSRRTHIRLLCYRSVMLFYNTILRQLFVLFLHKYPYPLQHL